MYASSLETTQALAPSVPHLSIPLAPADDPLTRRRLTLGRPPGSTFCWLLFFISILKELYMESVFFSFFMNEDTALIVDCFQFQGAEKYEVWIGLVYSKYTNHVSLTGLDYITNIEDRNGDKNETTTTPTSIRTTPNSRTSSKQIQSL